MLHFLCRTVTVLTAHRLSSLQKYTFLSVNYISSASNANRHSFVVSYLINSCGLSLESALSASKRVHFETPERADSVLNLFEKHGFTKPQISILIKQLPQLLASSPEKTLLPKLDFFHSKGFSNPDITRILCFEPGILKRSLEKQIIPAFNFLKDLVKSDETTIAAIRRCPRILLYRIDSYWIDNVRIMREYGVSESCIVTLVRYQPRTFMMIPDAFKKIVDEVKRMGFDPSKLKFGLAVFAFRAMSRSTWDKKVDVYKKWGLSEEEVFEAFGRTPWFMMASENKIMAMMDFFVNKMGWEYSFIVKRPALITLSLKRIVPRGTLFQFLLSKGLLKENLYIPSFFEAPEKLFRKKFVDCFIEEAPEVLKLYPSNFSS